MLDVNSEIEDITNDICVSKLNLMGLYDLISNKNIKRQLNEIINLIEQVEDLLDKINEESANKKLISVTFSVFHFDISGNDINE